MAAVFAGLLATSFISTAYPLQVQRAERLRAEQAMAAALSESRTRGRVIQFMQRVFSEARVDRVGPEGTLQDALRIAAEDVLELESVHDEPEVLAAVHESLGIVYRDYLGGSRVLEGNPARNHLERALAIRREALGDDHPDVGASYLELADLAFFEGRYGVADALAGRAIGIFRGHPDIDSRRLATAAYNLAMTIDLQGRHAEAEPLFRQTLAWERELNGGEITPWVSITVQKLGACLEAQGRYDEAPTRWCAQRLACSEARRDWNGSWPRPSAPARAWIWRLAAGPMPRPTPPRLLT